jgi:hypothetical protein
VREQLAANLFLRRLRQALGLGDRAGEHLDHAHTLTSGSFGTGLPPPEPEGPFFAFLKAE